MESEFEAKVEREIRRLKTGSLNEIEAEVAHRRTSWLYGRPSEQSAAAEEKSTPRAAFDVLFFDYMKLAPADLPVLRESDREIVWASKNPCPTLEACLRLGLDTRIVCRGAYEKSTQAFLSLIDPELRFLRDYGEIRPHSAHCLERIVRVNFEGMMQTAVEEAGLSLQAGNKGYGAAIAFGTDILARAHDTAATDNDPSLHAEVNAIRHAVRTHGDSNLSGAVLFSTCEPCPMCSSLAVWANISAIVFGASIEETARLGKRRIMVPALEIALRSPVMMEVIPGVLRKECLALYRAIS